MRPMILSVALLAVASCAGQGTDAGQESWAVALHGPQSEFSCALSLSRDAQPGTGAPEMTGTWSCDGMGSGGLFGTTDSAGVTSLQLDASDRSLVLRGIFSPASFYGQAVGVAPYTLAVGQRR